jgi:hypothetical protein
MIMAFPLSVACWIVAGAPAAFSIVMPTAICNARAWSVIEPPTEEVISTTEFWPSERFALAITQRGEPGESRPAGSRKV